MLLTWQGGVLEGDMSLCQDGNHHADTITLVD